ncbi:MAG: UDP-N-acetylmuramoyl-L-alanyl-D-glutamate--2,6-diaminopimelate ligase [Firmicutes bacterium]|mgnify:CR=1 FL=1|nr:UDP-N-acetylmuramoyl-L-alanyl-D-glutamate--2,6-diaminopimelate ligase [Bacillota bacterium]
MSKRGEVLSGKRAVTCEELASHIQGCLVGDGDVRLRGLTHDSRQVRPGDIFVCIPGARFDGHDFAPAAVEQGAVALIVERPLGLPVPQIIVPASRRVLGKAAALVSGYPSRQLRVIGVTGTKGKTTTTYLIRHVLESAGKKAGLIGTIEHVAGSQRRPSARTTPEASDIQVLLSAMVEARWDAVVMEVSSHATEMGRIEGTEFDVAVFTNITRDHMDFHPSFEHYLHAKLRLFAQVGVEATKGHKAVIVNVDDPHWEHFARAARVPMITVGIDNPADLRAEDVSTSAGGSQFRIGDVSINLDLTGRFNVYNALCALAVAVHEGIPLKEAAEALERVSGVPGRFERIDIGQEFAVIVDYAHTEDSLRNVLTAARDLSSGRVISVCGAGGDRDRGKRPLMGQALAELSDQVIITSDNPRSESPEQICADMVSGIQSINKTNYEVILDRQAAIEKAIKIAQPGDVVLIAGKGHETYQEFADHRVHFDDREIARAALERRQSTTQA